MKRPDPVLTVYDDRKCENPLCAKTYRPKRYWQRFCSPTCRLFCFMDRRFTAEQSKVPRDPSIADQERMLQDGREGAIEQARQAVLSEKVANQILNQQIDWREAEATLEKQHPLARPSALSSYDPYADPDRPAYPGRQKPPTIDDLD